MTHDQALRKVLACLRLAASSNPTEAATALRQARVLMAKYGLNEHDAEAAQINEADAITGFRGGMIPRSMAAMARMIADGYRCELVVNRGLKTSIRFFGSGADAQVAAYAFSVLRRQLQADKGRHTSRIRKRANKDARGEQFAIGWVFAVSKLFPREELLLRQKSAIELAIRRRVGATTPAAAKEIGKTRQGQKADLLAGYEAGQRARLNQGLAQGQKMLEVL